MKIPSIRNALSLKWLARRDASEPDASGYTTLGRTNNVGEGNAVVAQACISIMSDTMTRLPRFVGREGDPQDSYWEPDHDHPVSVLLQNPSPYWDPWEFWNWFFRCRFTTGNAYAEIVRRGGRPVELIPAVLDTHPTESGIMRNLRVWDSSTGLFKTRTRPVAVSDVLALHGHGYNGIRAPSPIQFAARRALEGMGSAQEHIVTMLERGQVLRQVIESDMEFSGLTAEQRKTLKDDLERSYMGAVNAGRVPVLPPGFEVKSMQGVSAVDLQLMDFLAWNALDLCRVWNVPPRMVFVRMRQDRVANSSVELDAESFVRWSVQPEADRTMAQLSAKLLTTSERMDRLGVRLTSDRIGVGSWTERVMAADTAVAKAGVLTPNEGRSRLGYPPHADGDRLLSPTGAPAQGPAAPGGPAAPAPDMDEEDEGE